MRPPGFRGALIPVALKRAELAKEGSVDGQRADAGAEASIILTGVSSRLE
jgi:hypothetical protein